MNGLQQVGLTQIPKIKTENSGKESLFSGVKEQSFMEQFFEMISEQLLGEENAMNMNNGKEIDELSPKIHLHETNNKIKINLEQINLSNDSGLNNEKIKSAKIDEEKLDFNSDIQPNMEKQLKNKEMLNEKEWIENDVLKNLENIAINIMKWIKENVYEMKLGQHERNADQMVSYLEGRVKNLTIQLQTPKTLKELNHELIVFEQKNSESQMNDKDMFIKNNSIQTIIKEVVHEIKHINELETEIKMKQLNFSDKETALKIDEKLEKAEVEEIKNKDIFSEKTKENNKINHFSPLENHQNTINEEKNTTIHPIEIMTEMVELEEQNMKETELNKLHNVEMKQKISQYLEQYLELQHYDQKKLQFGILTKDFGRLNIEIEQKNHVIEVRIKQQNEENKVTLEDVMESVKEEWKDKEKEIEIIVYKEKENQEKEQEEKNRKKKNEDYLEQLRTQQKNEKTFTLEI